MNGVLYPPIYGQLDPRVRQIMEQAIRQRMFGIDPRRVPNPMPAGIIHPALIGRRG